MNQLFEKTIILLFFSVLSACGGGGSSSISTATSLKFDLPQMKNIALDDPEIDISFTVDGNACVISVIKKSVDCGSLIISEHVYSLEYREKESQLLLANAEDVFNIEKNKNNVISPVLSYGIVESNNTETNYQLYINQKIANTMVEFPLPIPKGSEKSVNRMDVLINVNGHNCSIAWDDNLINCHTLDNWGISMDNLVLTYDILFKEKDSGRVLAVQRGDFDVIVGEINVINLELDTSANDNANEKTNLEEYLASFDGNWDQMYWGRGHWVQ